MKIILFGFMLFGLLGSVSSINTEDKVVNACITAESDFLIILDLISNHITGQSTLSNTQITSAQAALESEIELLINNETVIYEALQLVVLFETVKGPLFVQGSSSQGGYSRTASGKDLENFMMYLQQSIMDYSYSTENLNAYPDLFENTKYETSSYFPGAVAPPANENVSYTVKINGKHVKNSGAPANYETEDARRPTGCYLAPGSVATVTVPSSLVGIGASVLVGAHTWDNSIKPNIKRFDRVTKKYAINSTSFTIANPLGGGIYINVPFQRDLGILNITLRNVVRSPYYANTAANKTTVSQWQNTERLHKAPWTDFESDKVMMQVPTSWVYAIDDPSVMMNDWDLSMDAISEMLGRPLVRSKTVVYHQVDLQLRGSANFPGYPFANTTYNPFTNYNGNHNNFMVRGPRNDRSNAMTVFFHELGHAEKVYKFNGEVESFVNYLWAAVFNKKFGIDIDTAFLESSTTTVKHTIDEAAISWMITENFREGNPMSLTTGQFRQEFSYQPRGYAKYADIVQLFGWESLEKFYQTLNEDYDAGTYESANINVNYVPTDSRVLRMSVAAGYDLRPLLHFWGKHPDNFNSLANSIQASGVEQSAEIYDRLQYYKTIVPNNNNAFRSFGLNDFSQSSISNASLANQNNVSQSYTQSFFRKFWNTYTEDEGEAAINEIQNIIDLYFPNGRPNEEKITFVPDPNKLYYIDSPFHNVRLASTGESEDVYTTSISTVGEDVEWKFVDKGNGSWHIQRAAGGTLPKLRTDNTISDGTAADMQGTDWNGVYTYFDFEEGAIENTFFITLPDGPAAHVRLQIDNSGNVQMVENTKNGTWESFKITEVQNTGVPIGQTIWLKSLANDKYVRNKDNDGDLVEANTTNQQGVWVPFTIEDTGDGMIALKSGVNGKYVAADTRFDNTPLVADREVIGSWEKFTWINNPDGTISLQANSNGLYVCADKRLGINYPLVANRDGIGSWEKFYWGTYSASKELEADTNVQIYPNPVVSTATIANAAGSTLNVYDMNGRVVFSKVISSESETIDLSDLTSGVYYAKTNNEINNLITIKVVKD